MVKGSVCVPVRTVYLLGLGPVCCDFKIMVVENRAMGMGIPLSNHGKGYSHNSAWNVFLDPSIPHEETNKKLTSLLKRSRNGARSVFFGSGDWQKHM